jgi:hypothetical protein
VSDTLLLPHAVTPTPTDRIANVAATVRKVGARGGRRGWTDAEMGVLTALSWPSAPGRAAAPCACDRWDSR